MRTTTVIGCLIVMVIIGWILFGGDQGLLDSDVGDDQERSAGSGDAGSPGEPTPGKEIGPAEDLPDVIRTKPFSPPKEPVVVRSGRRIRVVEAVSGKPVPKIVVGFLDMKAAGPASILGGEHGLLDIEGHIERLGLKLQADAHGEVLVPRTKNKIMVCAQTETLFGLETIEPAGPDPATLKLEAVGSGSIQVLGPDGAPRAGVPVAVTLELGGMAQMVVWRGVTKGAKGLVRLRNLNVATRMFTPSGMDVAQMRLLAVLGVPVKKPPEVLLVDHKFPEDPVQLRLPETGRVVVRVTQPEDRALALNLHQGLNPFMAVQGMETAFSAELMRVLTSEGKAVFPLVGLDLSLKLDVADPARLLASKQFSLAGPRLPEKEVAIEVALDTPSPALTGLVVDAEGNPWAGGTLTVLETPLIPAMMFSDEGMRFETDEKGRFRIPLSKSEAEQNASGPLIVSTRYKRTAPSSEVERLGRVTITGPYPAGNSDIGEITLREIPIAVTGRVIDEQQQPVRNALIKMNLTSSAQADLQDSDPRFLDDQTVHAGPDGKFVIRAQAGNWTVTLRYSCSGYCSPDGYRMGSKPARIGDRDVELTLMRAGAISGSVRLDPGIRASLARVAIAGGIGSVTPGDDGRFEIRDLKPGNVDVHVAADLGLPGEPIESSVPDGPPGTIAETPGLLAKITGVKVIAGQTSNDPRLQGIDLRGKFARFELLVIGPDGRPVAGARITTDQASSSLYASSATTSASGEVTLVAPGPALPVTVSKTGFLDTKLDLSPGKNRIALERGYLVRLTLAPELEVPGSKFMLVATLVPESGKGESIRPETASGATLESRFFTDAWVAQLLPPSPGRYTVQLAIIGGLFGGGTPVHAVIEHHEPEVIEVRPGEYLTEVQIRISPAELEKALKRQK